MSSIRLIVGLANPGAQYTETRHNAGSWFVVRLAELLGVRFQPDSKLSALIARTSVGGEDIRLMIPTTFMNHSGRAVGAVAGFYKLSPDEILVAHDELDLAPGQIRVKTGGGHGGHNGLRDTISALANNNSFHRLRIGIGHPGDRDQVTNFVLGKASRSEQDLIDSAIDEALRLRDTLLTGNLAHVMNQLNGFQATS